MSYLKHIRQDLQDMQAYTVQNATGMVKLDAMENPFPLPEQLQALLGERLGKVAVNRYPGSRIEDLKYAIAQHVGQWFRRVDFLVVHGLPDAGCECAGTRTGFCDVRHEREIAKPSLHSRVLAR